MGFDVLIKVYATDWILGKVTKKIKTFSKKKAFQLLITLSLLLIYFHMYYFVILDPDDTFYHKIGISNKAEMPEIKKSLKTVLRQNHPDRNADDKNFLFFNEISDVLKDTNKKWLYDRFKTSLKETNKSFEILILGNYISFIIQGVISIFFISLFGLSGSIFYFKEIFLFLISLVCLTTYLYFIKDSFDIFDILFPQMTIFQIKECIWQNVIILEKVLGFILEYFVYSEQNLYLQKLKAVQNQISKELKKIN